MHIKMIAGRAYHYDSVRRDGKPRSSYVGPCHAEFVALHEREREREAMRLAEAKAAKEVEAREVHDREKVFAEFFGHVEKTARDMLDALGFHKQGRGPWRKKRMKAETPTPLATAAPAKAIRQPRHLNNRGLGGATGDVARHFVERSILKKFAESTQDAMRGGVEDAAVRFAERLAGPDSSDVEYLLAERAGIAWQDSQRADLEAELARDRGAGVADRNAYERAQERAERRYLGALRAFAAVKRLDLRGVMVNVGLNQVNIQAAGSTPGAASPAQPPGMWAVDR